MGQTRDFTVCFETGIVAEYGPSGTSPGVGRG